MAVTNGLRFHRFAGSTGRGMSTGTARYCERPIRGWGRVGTYSLGMRSASFRRITAGATATTGAMLPRDVPPRQAIRRPVLLPRLLPVHPAPAVFPAPVFLRQAFPVLSAAVGIRPHITSPVLTSPPSTDVISPLEATSRRGPSTQMGHISCGRFFMIRELIQARFGA